MKKTILKSALIAVTCLGASGAIATPFNSTLLQSEIDNRTEGGVSSINVQTDMIDDNADSVWQITASNGSVNNIAFEIAGFRDGNSFGIYDTTNSSNRLEIFDGPDSPGAFSAVTLQTDGMGNYSIDSGVNIVSFGSGQTFGYYLDIEAQGFTYFSDTAENHDGIDHMLAYQGVEDQFSILNNGAFSPWTDNEVILAWEDLEGGGDFDYTDFVVMVESVEPQAVPEPATMLLFGIGLIGLAGWKNIKA